MTNLFKMTRRCLTISWLSCSELEVYKHRKRVVAY